MPNVNTLQLVKNKFIYDAASPIAITAATWGPNDGHFIITPYSAGQPTAIRLDTLIVHMAATSLTSVRCAISLDAAGTVNIGMITGTVGIRSAGNYVITFTPGILLTSMNISDAILTSLSTTLGVFYLRFYTDVNATISIAIPSYTLQQVAP